MKQKNNVTLSVAQKKAAKKKTFSVLLKSFKIEGIDFSPQQKKELRSRLEFSK